MTEAEPQKILVKFQAQVGKLTTMLGHTPKGYRQPDSLPPGFDYYEHLFLVKMGPLWNRAVAWREEGGGKNGAQFSPQI